MIHPIQYHHRHQGRGFALSGSLQLLDSRHGPDAPAVVMPMREVSSKELALLCRARKFSTLALSILPGGSLSSVNQLAEAFIEGLQVSRSGL